MLNILFVREGSLVAGHPSTVQCSVPFHAPSQSLKEPTHLEDHQEGTVSVNINQINKILKITVAVFILGTLIKSCFETTLTSSIRTVIKKDIFNV